MGVKRVSCGCQEGALLESGGCLECVWRVSCRCLEGVLLVFGGCLVGAWRVSIVPPFHKSIAVKLGMVLEPPLHMLGVLLYRSRQCKKICPYFKFKKEVKELDFIRQNINLPLK